MQIKSCFSWSKCYILAAIMLSGSYLLVITERECVGSYLGHPIFKVSSLKVFPCDHSLKNSPLEQVNLLCSYCLFLLFANCCFLTLLMNHLWQKKMETEFSGLLGVTERTPGLYFSYDINITLRWLFSCSLLFLFISNNLGLSKKRFLFIYQC